jgi:hypothetical protein
MAIETIGKDLVRTQKHYWREVILGHAVPFREAGGFRTVMRLELS